MLTEQPAALATLDVPVPVVAPVGPDRGPDGAGRRRGRLTAAALVGLVGAGILLRAWALGAHRLDFDEAFTALTGRRSFTDLLGYLRVRDSHPPLDYLVRAPLARAGAGELLLRLPSVVFSVAALALFAWWMRARGVAGIVATGVLALSSFQIVHGREARMYADLELIGVAVAIVAASWLRRPRRWHAPAIGALVSVGLMTHVSMLVLGAGLLVIAGLRRDRDAWRWRLALVTAFGAWAVLWGPTFLVQSRGGHSDWIPPTTPGGFAHTVGGLVTSTSSLQVVAFVAVLAGAALVVRRAEADLRLVFVGCVLVPTALVALAGFFEPMLLDRTMTAWSWGPALALGFLVAAISRRAALAAALAIAALALAVVPAGVHAVAAPSNVDRAVRHVERVARAGDVIASHTGARLHLLTWSVAVRHHRSVRPIAMDGPGNSRGELLGRQAPTGRTWLLVSTRLPPGPPLPRCAPDWSAGSLHVLCLQSPRRAP
jgi:hypothetical protein